MNVERNVLSASFHSAPLSQSFFCLFPRFSSKTKWICWNQSDGNYLLNLAEHQCDWVEKVSSTWLVSSSPSFIVAELILFKTNSQLSLKIFLLSLPPRDLQKLNFHVSRLVSMKVSQVKAAENIFCQQKKGEETARTSISIKTSYRAFWNSINLMAF